MSIGIITIIYVFDTSAFCASVNHVFLLLVSSLFIMIGLDIVCFQSEDVRSGAGFIIIHRDSCNRRRTYEFIVAIIQYQA